MTAQIEIMMKFAKAIGARQPTSNEFHSSHTPDGVREGHASAVLAASIFHFGTYTIGQAKAHMANAGLPMRLDPSDL